jgi:hypothetical protein
MQSRWKYAVGSAGSVLAALALVAAAGSGREQEIAQDPEHGGAEAEQAEEKTPLVVNMEILRDGLRDLRRDLTDVAGLTARLDLVVAMQTAAKATKTLVPPLVEEQPESERAAFVLGYRKEMIAVEEELLRLERAILDADLAAAKESYKKLKQMEEDGHERFSEGG